MNQNMSEKLRVGELRVEGLTALGSDARFMWGLVPLECKRALVELERAGRLQEARAFILQDAEESLKLTGPMHSMLDYCAAMEIAAEHWLRDHPVTDSQSPIDNRQREAA
jgi:hypothetical protein